MSANDNMETVGVLTIANGGTNSSELSSDAIFRRDGALMIYGPAALTGTCTVELTFDGSTWCGLQSPPGTNVAVAATKVIAIDARIAFKALRIRSGSAEGASRTFVVMQQRDVNG